MTIYTEDVYTFADGEVTTYSAETYSTLMQATPTVSSFSAVSTETSVDSYDEVTYINILLPSDVAEEFDPYYDDPDYIDRYDNSYMVALTYSADEDYCTRDGENWVWTTGVSISVPYGAKPTAISSSLSMTQFSAFDPTSTFTHLYINPTEVPASSLSSLSSYYSEYWMDYSCTVPASKASGIVTGAVASSTPSSNADSDDTNSSPSSSIVSGGRESQCEDGDWWWYSDWGFGGEVECRTGPDVVRCSLLNP